MVENSPVWSIACVYTSRRVSYALKQTSRFALNILPGAEQRNSLRNSTIAHSRALSFPPLLARGSRHSLVYITLAPLATIIQPPYAPRFRRFHKRVSPIWLRRLPLPPSHLPLLIWKVFPRQELTIPHKSPTPTTRTKFSVILLPLPPPSISIRNSHFLNLLQISLTFLNTRLPNVGYHPIVPLSRLPPPHTSLLIVLTLRILLVPPRTTRIEPPHASRNIIYLPMIMPRSTPRK